MGYDPGGPNISAVHLYLGAVSEGAIAWTLRDDLVKAGTANVNWSLTSPDQASVQFIAASGSIPVSEGMAIKITHSGSPRQFGGTIDTLSLTAKPGSGKVSCDCQCVSWDRLLTKRRAWEHNYVNQYLGDIVTSLILNCMGGDGMSATTIPGPVIPSFSTDYSMTVQDAINRACQLATDDADTYYAHVDYDRSLVLAKQSTTAAPWGVDDRDGTDGNALHGDQYQISAQKTLQKYSNVALAKASKLITDATTEALPGDGAARSFTTSKPIELPPTVLLYTTAPVLSDSTPQTFSGEGSRTYALSNAAAVVESVTVNGVEQSFSTSSSDQWTWTPGDATITQNAGLDLLTGGDTLVVTYRWDTGASAATPTEQTVGVAGVDTGKNWYWAADSNTLTQDAGGTTLTASQSLSVTYQTYDVGYAKYVFAASVNDRAAIESGTGYYEVSIAIDTPITAAGLSALVEAYAKKYGKPPRSVTISTLRPGLATGQLIPIHLDDYEIDDSFLIDTLSLLVGDSYCVWTAHCIAGAMIGDTWKAWAELASSGASAGGGSSVGPTSPSDNSNVTANGLQIAYDRGYAQQSTSDFKGDHLSVKMFSAKGDGVTDDTSAFASAIASALPVFVPPGTYCLSTLALPSGTVLFGNDPKTTILQSVSGSATLLTASRSSHINIYGLTLDGELASPGYVIRFAGVDDVDIHDCIIHNGPGSPYAIVIGNSDETPWVSPSNIRIRNNTIYKSSASAGVKAGIVAIDGMGFYPFYPARNIEVSRNTIYSGSTATDESGLLVSVCENVLVHGNTVYDVGGFGLVLDTMNAGSLIVSANSTHDCGYAGIGHIGSLMYSIPFSGGESEPIGITAIAQSGSGATALTSGVDVTSGSWAGGDAAGVMTLYATGGVWAATGALMAGATTIAQTSGALSGPRQSGPAQIIGNTCDDNGNSGIAIYDGNGSAVSGNIVRRNAYRGIDSSGTADRSVITGNVCQDNAGGIIVISPTTAAGIYVNGTYAVLLGNQSGNVTTSNQQYGIAAFPDGLFYSGGNILEGNAVDRVSGKVLDAQLADGTLSGIGAVMGPVSGAGASANIQLGNRGATGARYAYMDFWSRDAARSARIVTDDSGNLRISLDDAGALSLRVVDGVGNEQDIIRIPAGTSPIVYVENCAGMDVTGNINISAAGNAAGDAVTTDATQTLTNKDLTDPSNALPSADAGYKNNSLSATASAGLTLTTSYVDIPDCSVTLDKTGTWLITADVDFTVELSSGYGSAQLVCATVAKAPVINVGLSGSGTIAIMAPGSRTWIYAGTSGDVCHVEAKKSINAGSSTVSTNSQITAVWLHE